ncbi:MAG TPA: DUF1801 domain-containing protein [Flavitalea sp.]|nr:DUF1801 domain-containing protein [Flavitalea sp.]
MKKSTEEQVSEYIQKLDSGTAKAVNEIRRIILSASPEVGEQIKWNSPAFYYTGEMKAFDPKEYKRDIAVVNLHKGRLMIVFPTGAKVEDKSGLLEGDYKDGRRVVTYKNADDVLLKEKALVKVVKKWLALIER